MKDHLANATEELNNRLSGVQLNNTANQNVVVKTTTTTITQGNSGEVTSSTIVTTTRQTENS